MDPQYGDDSVRTAASTAAPAMTRDPMSRAAIRQTLWLGLMMTGGFLALMAVLALASSLTSSGSGGIGAVDVAANAISIRIRQEPPQLDSTRTRDVVSGTVLAHTIEGLLRYGGRNELVPGVAERWEMRPDGATFWLREDSVWSDGTPVTAHDFVFAWRTAVDPKTAALYAFLFYVIENAEAINTGELPPESLGAYAVSDRVLEVEFEKPVAYFDKLVAFPVYSPVPEHFYRTRDGRYGANAEDLLYNGPFMLTRWVHGSNMRYEKNPTYWNRDAIKLDVIEVPYIVSDTKAAMNLFRDGEIAEFTGLNAEALEQALDLRWPIGRFADGSVWYLELNQRPGRLTANLNFRKALQFVNDNSELVNKVLKIPSYSPADSFFPSWLRGVDAFFKQEYPPPVITPNVEQAREYLARAKAELGLDELPPIAILVDDTPDGSKQAEYYQNLFRRTLGLEVRIDKQIFKQRLAKMEEGDFDIVIAGWGPDYDDPLTFGDLFASWNLNNHPRYNNPELDAQVAIAQESLDQRERMAAFGEIQRILIEDVVVIPNYERDQMFVQDPRLKGVVRRAIGAEVDFTGAYLVETP